MVKLTFDNFFNFNENNSLDLTASGLYQLDAPNGSGKTSIMLIIEEILFGKTRKNVKKTDIINREKSSCKARLHINGLEVIYVRTKSGVELEAYLNGENITQARTPDTYQKISEVLGLDYGLFSSIAFQSVNGAIGFLSETPANRLAYLTKLFNLDSVSKAYSLLNTDLQCSQTNLSNAKAKYEGLNSAKTYLNISELKVVPPEMPFPDASILELNNKIKANNLKIAKLDELGPAETIDYDSDRAIGIEVKLKGLKNELRNITSLEPSCSKCGRPFDGVPADLDLQVLALKRSIHTLESQLAKEKSNFIKYNNELDKQRKRELIEVEIDRSLPTKLANEAELNDYRRKYADNQRVRQEAISHNNVVKADRDKLERLEKDLSALTEDLTKYQIEVDTLSKAKPILHPTGYISYKLNKLVKELTIITNSYLAKLSEGRFQMQFTEKLDVQIVDSTNIVDFDSLSTGEKARVSISVMLGLRKLLNKTLNLGFMFIDEVASVLDDSGKELLIDVLLTEHNCATILVAHGYTHPLLTKIKLKDNKVN